MGEEPNLDPLVLQAPSGREEVACLSDVEHLRGVVVAFRIDHEFAGVQERAKVAQLLSQLGAGVGGRRCGRRLTATPDKGLSVDVVVFVGLSYQVLRIDNELESVCTLRDLNTLGGKDVPVFPPYDRAWVDLAREN